jgi:hypothetical protein
MLLHLLALLIKFLLRLQNLLSTLYQAVLKPGVDFANLRDSLWDEKQTILMLRVTAVNALKNEQ